MTSVTDYPQGDGRPGCPDCAGRGVRPVPPERRSSVVRGEQTEICPCVYTRDLLGNLERRWRGLITAPKIADTPLKGREEANLWVTGTTEMFRAHFRHLALRKGPAWDFVVASDADLMDAWLSYDLDVLDADVDQKRQNSESSRYSALVDLVGPSALLVLITGVKAARNSAMPEVMLEAVQYRSYKLKPTWIVDTPVSPLAEGHISWCQQLGSVLRGWPHMNLGTKTQRATGKAGAPALPSLPVSGTTRSVLNASDTAPSVEKPGKRKGGKR